jgi:hypothetical protein
MSYYEQDGLQRTDWVGGGQFVNPGMGSIGEQQAAGVNHMDNIWSAQAKMDMTSNAGSYGSIGQSYFRPDGIMVKHVAGNQGGILTWRAGKSAEMKTCDG